MLVVGRPTPSSTRWNLLVTDMLVSETTTSLGEVAGDPPSSLLPLEEEPALTGVGRSPRGPLPWCLSHPGLWPLGPLEPHDRPEGPAKLNFSLQEGEAPLVGEHRRAFSGGGNSWSLGEWARRGEGRLLGGEWALLGGE